MTSNGTTLPPDDAWIERREEVVTAVEQSQAGDIPGKRTRRIVGNLRGSWPDHGRVRHLPTEQGQVTITEASLILLADGTVRPERT